MCSSWAIVVRASLPVAAVKTSQALRASPPSFQEAAVRHPLQVQSWPSVRASFLRSVSNSMSWIGAAFLVPGIHGNFHLAG